MKIISIIRIIGKNNKPHYQIRFEGLEKVVFVWSDNPLFEVIENYKMGDICEVTIEGDRLLTLKSIKKNSEISESRHDGVFTTLAGVNIPDNEEVTKLRQERIAKLRVDDPLKPFWDKENAYDDMAIGINCEFGMIGYLRRDSPLKKEIFLGLKNGLKFKAKVANFNEIPDSKYRGVNIEFVDFPRVELYKLKYGGGS